MIDLGVRRAVEINLFKVDNGWSEGVLRVGVLVVSVSGKLLVFGKILLGLLWLFYVILMFLLFLSIYLCVVLLKWYMNFFITPVIQFFLVLRIWFVGVYTIFICYLIAYRFILLFLSKKICIFLLALKLALRHFFLIFLFAIL